MLDHEIPSLTSFQLLTSSVNLNPRMTRPWQSNRFRSSAMPSLRAGDSLSSTTASPSNQAPLHSHARCLQHQRSVRVCSCIESLTLWSIMMASYRPIASLTRASFRTCRPSPSSRGIAQLVKPTATPKPRQSLRLVENPRSTAIVAFRPFSTSLTRLADKPFSEQRFEQKLEGEKIEANPGEVSTTSSIHPITSEQGDRAHEKDDDMLAELKSDMVGLCPAFPEKTTDLRNV